MKLSHEQAELLLHAAINWKRVQEQTMEVPDFQGGMLQAMTEANISELESIILLLEAELYSDHGAEI